MREEKALCKLNVRNRDGQKAGVSVWITMWKSGNLHENKGGEGMWKTVWIM